MPTDDFLNYFYDDYPQLEERFKKELNKSLNPQSGESRFDFVKKLNLKPNSDVLDLGCGDGRYTFKLAEHFGFRVQGVDPVSAHIKLCEEELAAKHADLSEKIDFKIGSITDIPSESETYDLVWCYDVLEHIDELKKAFTECNRVLRPGGYMLAYSQFATDTLESHEAKFMFTTMGFTPGSSEPGNVEAAYQAAGLQQKEMVEVQSEWEEKREEDSGSVSRHLLHASRLLRDPERYINSFGKEAYEIKLADCLWHVYTMIGKFSPRMYVLQK